MPSNRRGAGSGLIQKVFHRNGTGRLPLNLKEPVNSGSLFFLTLKGHMQTATDFFSFFSEIPKEKWIRKQYIDSDNPSCRCASGHLRQFVNEKGKWIFANALPNLNVVALDKIFAEFYGRSGLTLRINDGTHPLFTKSFSPKEAIVTALHVIMFHFNAVKLLKNENNGEFFVQLSNSSGATSTINSFPEDKEAEAKAYTQKWELLFAKKFKKLYAQAQDEE